jgi:hypothetical protein
VSNNKQDLSENSMHNRLWKHDDCCSKWTQPLWMIFTIFRSQNRQFFDIITICSVLFSLSVLITSLLDLLALALTMALTWHFGEHLSHALPTKMIFYLLQSIDLHHLQLYDYSLKWILDLLEIIIKWLEVSVSIYDRRTQLKSDLCLGKWVQETKQLVGSLPVSS